MQAEAMNKNTEKVKNKIDKNKLDYLQYIDKTDFPRQSSVTINKLYHQYTGR